MCKNIFLIAVIVVVLSGFGVQDTHALFTSADESGEGAVIKAVEEQKEEKALIAREVRAEKEKTKEKNDQLVSQVKARMAAQAQAASQKKGDSGFNVNLIVIIFAAVIFIGFRLIKRRK